LERSEKYCESSASWLYVSRLMPSV
jgi:hypothetical protein